MIKAKHPFFFFYCVDICADGTKETARQHECRWKHQVTLVVTVFLTVKRLGGEKPVSFKNVFYEEEKIINFITSTLGNTSF